jgi:hypothetical protein
MVAQAARRHDSWGDKRGDVCHPSEMLAAFRKDVGQSFSINSVNFDLGALLGELLKMLINLPFQPPFQGPPKLEVAWTPLLHPPPPPQLLLYVRLSVQQSAGSLAMMTLSRAILLSARSDDAAALHCHGAC